MPPFVIAAAGHRPRGLGNISRPLLWMPAVEVVRAYLVARCQQHGPLTVLTGMEEGFGLIVAAAAFLARDEGHPIGVTAALPFPGQPERWERASAAKWHARIVERCRTESGCSVELRCDRKPADQVEAEELAIANARWMVEKCDRLLTCWNGRGTNMTGKTSRLAVRARKPLDDVYSEVCVALDIRDLRKRAS